MKTKKYGKLIYGFYCKRVDFIAFINVIDALLFWCVDMMCLWKEKLVPYLVPYRLNAIENEISDISYGSYLTCMGKINRVYGFFPVDCAADEDCKESEELSSRYFTSA